MKGVLFNVVEDVVTVTASADAWDDVLDAADVSGSYTSLGNYPDAELSAIVEQVADTVDLSVDDTLRLSGRLGFEHLVARAPALIAPYPDWRSVIVALDDIIHPEVLKVYPDAEVPRFTVVDDSDGLVVEYVSARGLCALADGLIIGCGAWYDVALSVTHDSCVRRGDTVCTLRVVEEA